MISAFMEFKAEQKRPTVWHLVISTLNYTVTSIATNEAVSIRSWASEGKDGKISFFSVILVQLQNIN